MIIKLMGGLGNQMFQYALYKKLRSLGRHAVLDDRGLIRHGNQHNGLELEHAFRITYERMSRLETARYYVWFVRYLIHRKLGLRFSSRYFCEDHFQMSVNDIMNSSCKYFSGYWQNETYFRDIRDELLRDFCFDLSRADEKTIQTAMQIRQCESVSIHVRRGDFLSEDNRMGICTMEYYKSAVSYMMHLYPDAGFYIFSDDPAWIEENFFWMPYKLVYWNKGKSSYLDIYLMSICRHNIIANSTFSWWGAWLNQNKRKTVIGPEKWITDCEISLTLDSWIKIREDGHICSSGPV